MTECTYCGDPVTNKQAPSGYCSRRCAADAPAARKRLTALLAGKLPPPNTARTRGVDEIAVEIVANGDRHVPLNQIEIDLAIQRMTAAGLNTHTIAERTGRTRRTVSRYRNRKQLEEAS